MSISKWVHRRAHLRTLSHAHISKQRRTALWLTIFSAVRTVAWLICMLLIAIYEAGWHSSFLHGFVHLSSLVVWVSFISYYCNASTDGANLMAGIAALFSADSHAAAVSTSTAVSVDYRQVEADIARLAGLQPGPDAQALSAEICRRLTAPEGTP